MLYVAGLAQVADYYLPFLVVGLLPVLPAIVAIVLMKTAKPDSKQSFSMFQLLKIPGVLIMAIVTSFSFCAFIMLEPTLATHLYPYGLPLYLIGFVFLIQPFCFTIVSPITGKIVKRITPKLVPIIVGAYGMTMSYTFLGQSALMDMKEHKYLWPTLVGLVGVGTFWAIGMVPSYDRFIHYAKCSRPDINPATLMSTIGTLFWMMVSVGELAGPVVAGSILDAYGFPFVMFTAALLCFLNGTTLLITFICFGNESVVCCNRSATMDTEKDPLIASDISDSNRGGYSEEGSENK